MNGTGKLILFLFVLIVILIILLFFIEFMRKSRQPLIIGGCEGTRLGCCPDGVTSKADYEGSNCIQPLIPIQQLEPPMQPLTPPMLPLYPPLQPLKPPMLPLYPPLQP